MRSWWLWGSVRVWRNGGALPTVTLESILGPKREILTQFPKNPWEKLEGTTTIIGEEHGSISEKDVLNKIINAQRIPIKHVYDSRIYGSLAMAVIHPPDYFNLPEMIIMAWHIDKQSSFGAEELLSIYLKTPSGQGYVPVVTVGDNPEAVEFRKDVLGAGGRLARWFVPKLKS